MPLQDFPSAGPDLLATMVSTHAQGASVELRSGIALALSSSAPQWQSTDATAALDFLLARGFVEQDDEVRSAMVDAGESKWLCKRCCTLPAQPHPHCRQGCQHVCKHARCRTACL